MIDCNRRSNDEECGEASLPALNSKNLQQLNLIRKRRKSATLQMNGQASEAEGCENIAVYDTDDDDYSTVVPSEEESLDGTDNCSVKIADYAVDDRTLEELEKEEKEEVEDKEEIEEMETDRVQDTPLFASTDAHSIANSDRGKNLNCDYTGVNTNTISDRKLNDIIAEQRILSDEQGTLFENDRGVETTWNIREELNSMDNAVNTVGILDQTVESDLHIMGNKQNETPTTTERNCNSAEEISINEFNCLINESNTAANNNNNNKTKLEDILIPSRISPIYFDHQINGNNDNSEYENIENNENNENSNNENIENNGNSIPSHDKNEILKKSITSPGKLFVDTVRHEYVDDECSAMRSNGSAERSAPHTHEKINSKSITGGIQNSYNQLLSPLSPLKNGKKSFNLSPIHIQQKITQDLNEEKIKNEIFTEKFKMFLDICRVETKSKESKISILENVNTINNGFDKESIQNYLENQSKNIISKSVKSGALINENKNTEMSREISASSSLSSDDYSIDDKCNYSLTKRRIKNENHNIENNNHMMNIKNAEIKNKNYREKINNSSQRNYDEGDTDYFDGFKLGSELSREQGSEMSRSYSNQSSAKSEKEQKEEILKISSRSLASYFFPAPDDYENYHENKNENGERVKVNEYDMIIENNFGEKKERGMTGYSSKEKMEINFITHNTTQLLDNDNKNKNKNINKNISNDHGNENNNENDYSEIDSVIGSPKRQIIHDHIKEQKKYGYTTKNGKNAFLFGSSDCTTDDSVNLSGGNDYIDCLNNENGDNESLSSFIIVRKNNNKNDNNKNNHENVRDDSYVEMECHNINVHDDISIKIAHTNNKNNDINKNAEIEHKHENEINEIINAIDDEECDEKEEEENEDEEEEEEEVFDDDEVDEHTNNENNVTKSTYYDDYFDYSVYEEYHRYSDSTATITETYENDGYYYQNERSQKGFLAGNEIDFDFLDQKKKKKLSGMYLDEKDDDDDDDESFDTSTSSSPSSPSSSTSSSSSSHSSHSQSRSQSHATVHSSSTSSSTLSQSCQIDNQNSKNNNRQFNNSHLTHENSKNDIQLRKKITVQNVDFYATEKHGIYKRDIPEMNNCSTDNVYRHNDSNDSHTNDGESNNYNTNAHSIISNDMSYDDDNTNYSNTNTNTNTNTFTNTLTNTNTYNYSSNKSNTNNQSNQVNQDNKKNQNYTSTMSIPEFIDFQIILTEDDFAVLEKRKQAANRVSRFNKSLNTPSTPSYSQPLKKIVRKES